MDLAASFGVFGEERKDEHELNGKAMPHAIALRSPIATISSIGALGLYYGSRRAASL